MYFQNVTKTTNKILKQHLFIMVKKIISICAAGMIVASCSPKKTTAQPTDPSTTDSELTMLVGTYTSGNSKGIYTFRFNEETGESLPLSDAEVATERTSSQPIIAVEVLPSFLSDKTEHCYPPQT